MIDDKLRQLKEELMAIADVLPNPAIAVVTAKKEKVNTEVADTEHSGTEKEVK